MSYALRHCAVWVLSLFYFVEQITGQQSAASVFELSNQNFYQTLESWPADNGVFLEFYAHWCPACKRFQPQYEKLAAYFNAEPRVQPIVNVARVDCANEVPRFADHMPKSSFRTLFLSTDGIMCCRESCARLSTLTGFQL